MSPISLTITLPSIGPIPLIVVIGQFNDIETLSDVYVIGADDSYTRIARNVKVSTETKVETDFAAGTNHFVYKSFVEMAEDSSRSYEGFGAPLWIYKEGGLPYAKAQNVSAPVFSAAPSEITKGTSAEFTVSANARLMLDEAAILAGLTIENGVVSVPAGIGNATYTVIATSIFDPTLKAEVSFNVINARESETIEKAHEIDLGVADDGSVNESQTTEIDLTEKFTGDANVSIVKIGDEIINGYDDVRIVGGKVTLNVAPFGIKYYGAKELKLIFSSDNVDYEYTVSVIFITKTVTSETELQAVKTLATALQGGGYYRLGGNVTLKNGWFTTAVDYRIGADYAFIGTLDGQGYAISGLRLSGWTQGGFIHQLGESGVVKNIAFTDVRLGAAASIIYTGAGTIENVYVKISIMPANGTGDYYSAGWRGNETAVFGCRTQTNTFKLKNVCVDYTATSTYLADYSNNAYVMLFGKFESSAVIENVVVTGMNKDVFDKVTNSSAVYVAYTDDTDNGVTFPASGWNETYWTVSENTVSWKTK